MARDKECFSRDQDYTNRSSGSSSRFYRSCKKKIFMARRMRGNIIKTYIGATSVFICLTESGGRWVYLGSSKFLRLTLMVSDLLSVRALR